MTGRRKALGLHRGKGDCTAARVNATYLSSPVSVYVTLDSREKVTL
jgi:hypothetical protein